MKQIYITLDTTDEVLFSGNIPANINGTLSFMNFIEVLRERSNNLYPEYQIVIDQAVGVDGVDADCNGATGLMKEDIIKILAQVRAGTSWHEYNN